MVYLLWWGACQSGFHVRPLLSQRLDQPPLIRLLYDRPLDGMTWLHRGHLPQACFQS